MIRFENVSKKYPDGTKAVHSVNMDIKQGEFFVIIGPSGSGKTTLLKMINRLIPLTEGTIFINDKKISEYNIHELRWNIGYVLQQIALFPHMTIEENISIVPELKKWARKKTKENVMELLQMVGLDPDTYLQRKPMELSGGQQQRIGVIRALAADPKIVLMDEPFSALDPISREKLQDDIKEIQNSIKKTTVFVTHDMEEALKLADRICIMKNGEIVQIGTPQELIDNPANKFVENFVGTHQTGLQKGIKLEDVMDSIQEEILPPSPSHVISVSTSFEDMLEHLTKKEKLIIEKDGTYVGTINRQMIIQYFANKLDKNQITGGNKDE